MKRTVRVDALKLFPCKYMSRRTIFRTLLMAVAAAAAVSTGRSVIAGGGPENLFLVVNANSDDSKTIANHYIAWRQIPASNVLYVDWKASTENCPSKIFRARLLEPILETIQRRGLLKQIDLIVYSSDFPWVVNFKEDFEGDRFPGVKKKFLSLTTATYFWQRSLASDRRLFAMNANHYAPGGQVVAEPDGRVPKTPSQAFRSGQRWASHGVRDDKAIDRYYLSTMLAVTRGRGNTVDESLRYLARSIEVDGARPTGTFYFVQNKSVRSQPRHGEYPAAIAELKSLGMKAELLPGKFLSNKKDVMGLMVGTPLFDLDAANLNILPGAFCDHLTSYGGDLRAKATQTPLTEFLRHGAAGASGTVTEPYAIAEKFPSPFLHVHYAKGCSLAESFYQSVAAPCQLLIVGDALCQPWARTPKVAVAGLESGATVKGKVRLNPEAVSPLGAPVKKFRLFVDGRLTMQTDESQPFLLDTNSLADGYHELRVVAIGPSEIECQGRVVTPFFVNNHGRKMEFSVTPKTNISPTTQLKLSARAEGAGGIVILHNRRVLTRINGDSGDVTIDAAKLGGGPVTLQAVAIGANAVASEPVTLQIDRARAEAGANLRNARDGSIAAVFADRSGAPRNATRDGADRIGLDEETGRKPYVH